MGFKSRHKDGQHFHTEEKPKLSSDQILHKESSHSKINMRKADEIRNRKSKINLVNRASSGIRIVSDKFYHNGKSLFVTVDVHHPKGKYLVEESDGLTSQPTSAPTAEFDTFEKAKNFIKAKYGLEVNLDKKNSNDYQTWEENIKKTDHDLPFERKFWALPEHIRSQIGHESIPEFMKKLEKKTTIKNKKSENKCYWCGNDIKSDEVICPTCKRKKVYL